MKIKQKTILFAVILGCTAGLMSAAFVTILPSSTAMAQDADSDVDPCATVPAGWDETLKACRDAVEKGNDPCDAIYTRLMEDTSKPEEQRVADAERERDNCRDANGQSGGDDQPPEEIPPAEDKCDPSKETCCGKVRTSIITGNFCNEDGDDPNAPENSAIFGLLKIVLQIMTAGVGVAAVGGIGYGAILYASAENKPDQTKKAIGIITNVVIGIAAYAMMYVLLNFLIPGGIFG